MHIPVSGNRPALLLHELVLVETSAKNPEPQAVGILDSKIVPRQHLAVRSPPFHGDTLGPFHPHHRMQRTAPGELVRSSVRDCCERHLDRLWPVEQPQWPQRRFACNARGPFGLSGGGKMMLG